MRHRTGWRGQGTACRGGPARTGSSPCVAPRAAGAARPSRPLRRRSRNVLTRYVRPLLEFYFKSSRFAAALRKAGTTGGGFVYCAASRHNAHAHLLRGEQRPDAAADLHHRASGLCRPPAGPRRRLRVGRTPVARRRPCLGDAVPGQGGTAEDAGQLREGAAGRRHQPGPGAAGRLRRGLPPQQPQPGRARRRRLQPGHRVRPAAEAVWGDGVQRPRRAGAGGVEDVPGRISRWRFARAR